MEDDFDSAGTGDGNKSSKIKSVYDYLLIIRDRWLLSITLSLPVALGYVYKESQKPEYFASNSTFRLIPPPAILNLQKVERDQQVQGLVAKHLDGLNSQELRMNVTNRIEENSEYKSVLLGPFLRDGIAMNVASTVNYTVSVSGPSEGRPRFTISSNSRSAKGAMIIADLVQSEYDKLHKSRKSQQVESVRNVLELLLKKSQEEEGRIAKDISEYKRINNMPFLEDEKRDNSVRKSQYHAQVTEAKLEQIKINSLLKQILLIQSRIGPSSFSVKSADLEGNIAAIKEYFEIDAIESFGSIPNLRESLQNLERMRRQYQQSGSGYLENHPKMLENARQIQEVNSALNLEVKSAIEDLRDKHIQFSAQENAFTIEMEQVQSDSNKLSNIQDNLSKYERQLSIVRRSIDQIHERLNDVRIEQALPTDQEDPLHKENFAFVPGAPYTPYHAKTRTNGVVLFFGLFVLIPFAFEFLDNRVKSPWDIEIFMSQDLVGGIPKISEVEEKHRPMIVGNDLDDGLTESFRSMYSRIQMNSRSDYPKIILVTSAIPSEGKSLISANLAYSCANHGRKTILIDFDMRRPGLHDFCNIPNDKGLLTVVNEAKKGEQAIVQNLKLSLHDVHPNLSVLPSGGKTRAATEMLERSEFDLVVEQIRKIADVIIIDSPPIGLFPDSLAMARKVEEVLFVTRYGKVSRKVAKSLIENIQQTGANLLGVVLNDLPQKKTPGYYYSGYYGYGYFRYKYYNKYYSKDNKKDSPVTLTS